MQTALIHSKTMLTADMLQLQLQTSKVELKPGQRMFINYLSLPTPLKRAYSVADVQTEGEISILTFLIKLLPDGKGSNELRNLQIGQEV